MVDIHFSEAIRQAAPGLRVVKIEADVLNDSTSDDLWSRIVDAGEQLRTRYQLADINKRPAIAATRQAYKALGKDPNRYRPSADALCRRLVKSMDLYRTRSVVDAINLISIISGHSIGGFDADKIDGDTLTLGRGDAGEPFEAIGRGPLNIDGLPVYRDRIGGIGTPTSDNERTKLTPDTRHLLMLINAYGDSELTLDQVTDLAIDTLRRHCAATNITATTLNVH